MNPILEYLKSVIEGRDNLIPWSTWFAAHEDELQSLLKRGVFLRLKQNPLTEIPQILADFEVLFMAHSRPRLPVGPLDCSWIDPAWLQERVSSRHNLTYEKAQVGSYLYDQLLYLVELKRDGDELWYFDAPEDMQQNRLGSSGIALVRNGEIIHAVVQVMS